MYIQPTTNIKLLHNIPLDNTYEHTIYFDSALLQHGYFAYYTKYDLTNYSYQRVQRGKARVGINAENLYDCNYMMFQNTAFGNKWFYAFITSVEYINNDCSEISFELDVMQSWFFDYSFIRTFVEREHSVTDYIGRNITPEALEVGEYVFNGSYNPIVNMYEMVICIAIINVNDTSYAVDGNLYDGIYGGAELWVYDSNDIQTINAKLSTFVRNPDSVIGIYMFPKIFLGGGVPSTHRLPYGASAWGQIITETPISTSDTINGYLPRNAKLYTYPYNFYHVDNANGSELNLRYEFFANLTPSFKINGTITQPVEAILRTYNYKGVQSGNYDTLNTETLELSGYPMCSWNLDAYKAWLAQNSVPLALNTLGNLGAFMSQNSQGQYQANGGNILSQATGIFSQLYKASIAADISRGSFNNGGANVANGTQQFYGGRCSITQQYAALIDDYFDRFGYATRRIKEPNRNSRRYWNYVKTIGCTIEGSIPADDMRKICSIYDNGVTFWKRGAEVGHYELNNSLIR